MRRFRQFGPFLGFMVAGSIACSSGGSHAPSLDNSVRVETVSAAVQASGQPCTETQQGSVFTTHFDVTAGGGKGGDINFVGDRTVDLSNDTFASIGEQGTVQIGGSLVFSYTISDVSGQPVQATVQWGPHVTGATSGTFSLSANTLTGNIDGRVFDPFPIGGDPATAPFVDGGPSPALQGNGPLSDALARLKTAITNAQAQCSLPGSANSTPSSGPTTDSDPGHFTDTYATSGCHLAKAACDVGGGLAAVGCGIGCAFTFGLACGACIVGIPIATASCIAGVETTGACCPVDCGPSTLLNPATCCAGDESCLNGSTGLCCSAGKQACHGDACCGSDEDCQAGGVCCPSVKAPGKSFACNGSCCDATEDCQNGTQCCEQSKECGAVCCGRAGTIAEQFCVAPDLCCGPGAVECNGACCGGTGQNKVCNAGVCEFAPTIICDQNFPVCVDPATGLPLDPTPCSGSQECFADIGCCGPMPR